MIKRFNSLFVTMFGVGKVKFIPGTAGSFVTTILVFFYFHIFNLNSDLFLFLWTLFFIYSFYAVSTHIESQDDKDPREVVIDEFLGQCIPIYFYEISHGTTKESGEALTYYILFFFLFRYFDIFKPFPVSYFDRNFKNSFGVIIDDICAGLYVVLTLVCFMVIRSYIL